MKIGFIGMGNMGQALMKGMLKDLSAEKLTFSCATQEKKDIISAETGVIPSKDNLALVQECKYIILAIKPQVYADVFAQIGGKLRQDAVVISLAPGKTIDYISAALSGDGGKVRVVRAMPNTPALIGFGMTGVAYDESRFDEEEKGVIDRLFSAVGNYVKVPEESMSAVVCASGSSPAYVYMFISTLANAAADKGLDREDALRMVAEAVRGAAEMVLQTGQDPEDLRMAVCSKGGTTLAGIEQLNANGFTWAIAAATESCYKRSEELSK